MAHAVHRQLAHHLDWYAAGGRLAHKGMAHPVRAGFFRTGADRARHPAKLFAWVRDYLPSNISIRGSGVPDQIIR